MNIYDSAYKKLHKILTLAVRLMHVIFFWALAPMRLDTAASIYTVANRIASKTHKWRNWIRCCKCPISSKIAECGLYADCPKLVIKHLCVKCIMSNNKI